MPTPVLEGREITVTYRAPAYRGKISFGLGGASDYSLNLPFNNMMVLAKPWYDPNGGQSSGPSAAFLKASGALDANNFPYDPSFLVPNSQTGKLSMQTIFGYSSAPDAAYRADDYLLTWDGTAAVSVGNSGTSNVTPDTNSIAFTWTGQSNLSITVSDFTTTDNPTNFVLTRASRRTAFNEGQIFNPDYLAALRLFDIGYVRFMDWGQTNHSFIQEWSERTQPGQMRYRKVTRDNSRYSNVPIEYMVALANELPANPWICIPHQASDAYVTSFFNYLKDNLDPGLVAKVEWSNEVWNSGFDQYKWCEEQAKALWDKTGATAARSYGAMKAYKAAVIGHSIFTGDDASRLKMVLSSQVGNIDTTEVVLIAPTWRDNDVEEDYVPPHTEFDEVAVTCYFGSWIAGDHTRTSAVLDAFTNDGTQAAYDLIDQYTRQHAVVRAGLWAQHAALLDGYDMKLSAYEGGQHVHHYAQISYNTATRNGDGETTVFSFTGVGLPNDWFFLRVRVETGGVWRTLEPEEFEMTFDGSTVLVEHPLSGDPLSGTQRIRVQEREVVGTSGTLNPILAQYVNSEEMAAVYEYAWGLWPRNSEDAFMQFVDFGASSIYGSWGLFPGYAWVTNPTPRALFLMDVAGAPEE